MLYLCGLLYGLCSCCYGVVEEPFLVGDGRDGVLARGEERLLLLYRYENE